MQSTVHFKVCLVMDSGLSRVSYMGLSRLQPLLTYVTEFQLIGGASSGFRLVVVIRECWLKMFLRTQCKRQTTAMHLYSKDPVDTIYIIHLSMKQDGGLIVDKLRSFVYHQLAQLQREGLVVGHST